MREAYNRVEGRAMKPFYLSMLRCKDGSFYVGHTDDLERRIVEHGEGTCDGYTSRRRPVELVFVDEFFTRDEAIERERQLKGWSRAKKQALIEMFGEPLDGVDWLKTIAKHKHSLEKSKQGSDSMSDSSESNASSNEGDVPKKH